MSHALQALSPFPIGQAVDHVRPLAALTSLLRVIRANAAARAVSLLKAWIDACLVCHSETRIGTARMGLHVLGALRVLSRTCSGLAATSARFSTHQMVDSVWIVRLDSSQMLIGLIATDVPPVAQRLTASASSAMQGKSPVVHRHRVSLALLVKLESEASVLSVRMDGSRLTAELSVKNAEQVELVLVACAVSSVLVAHSQIRIARIVRPAWWDGSVVLV